MHEQQVQQIVAELLPQAVVVIKNPLGDGMHFHALIIDDSFEGVSLVERHRMVMNPLRAAFKEDAIHALSIKTYTKPEAQARAAVVEKFGLHPSDIS